jgi:hypothetical protein
VTRWRIVAVVTRTAVVRSNLELELSVDTDELDIVEAIERAAKANGIRLERQEPAGERSTSPARRTGSRRQRSS